MRVIPIETLFDGAGCEDETSGQVPKLDLPLVRRDFLKGSGVLMGTLAAGSVLATLAPSTVWAVELKALSKAEFDKWVASQKKTAASGSSADFADARSATPAR